MTTINILTVLPDLTMAERIQRGNYDSSHWNVSVMKYTVTDDQLGEWEWKLFSFDDIFTEDAIQLIQEEGFEPAQIGHLLAFGEDNYEEQWRYPILGLGSVVDLGAGPAVLGLWGLGVFRNPYVQVSERYVCDNCRYLGVRRRSVA